MALIDGVSDCGGQIASGEGEKEMNELEPKAVRSQWLWFGGPRRADRHDDDVVEQSKGWLSSELKPAK